jgi:hypothetical protein
MQVKGKLKRINPTEVVSDKFKKRVLHVETVEQYPQVIEVQFIQDKCDIVDKYQVGQQVEIGYNLKGREWTNPEGVVRVFNTVEGWYIKADDQAPVQAPQEATQVVEDDGDLPF